MSLATALPDYYSMEKTLISAEVPFPPAHVHGFICGILCATRGRLSSSWIKDLTGKKKSAALREMLLELFETSFHLMNEFSFEFALLLPSDDVDINVRSESLGAWCQGFITGLEKHKIPLKNREPNEVTEALDDMIEIAQISFGDIASNDEDENAYFELVEYVRLATLMIFHELNPEVNKKGDSND